jgi:hypothetical protein
LPLKYSGELTIRDAACSSVLPEARKLLKNPNPEGSAARPR